MLKVKPSALHTLGMLLLSHIKYGYGSSLTSEPPLGLMMVLALCTLVVPEELHKFVFDFSEECK